VTLGVSFTLQEETLAKKQLAASYELKDLGEAKLILEMKIDSITNSHLLICKLMI